MKDFRGSVLSESVADYVPPTVVQDDASSASEGSAEDPESYDESEEDVENSQSGDDTEPTPLAKGNEGWADAMSKILKTNKPKKKKTVVLSRAKTIQAIKASKTTEEEIGFEIEGYIKEEKPSIDKIEENIKSNKITGLPVVKRKEWESRGRVKPTLKDQEREKLLSKIAIKGVVQLFNAVQKHQTEVGNKLKEAGASEVRRERVLKSIDKRAFLDVLMGNSKSESVDPSVKAETKIELKAEPKSSAWSVLREDFLTDTTLKDWDKVPEEVKDEEMVEETLSSDEEMS